MSPGQRDVADRGSGTIEYLAILLVAGLSIGLVVTATAAARPDIVTDTRRLVCAVVGGGCEAAGPAAQAPPVAEAGVAPPDDEAFRPPPCLVSEVGEIAAAQVKIAFFTIGDDYGFIERTFADGRVTLTAVDGATIGLIKSGSTRIVDIGRLDDETQLGGSLSVSGGLEIKAGDTWSFASAAEAAAMREQLDAYLVQQVQIRNAGEGAAGLHLWLWLSDGYLDPPKPAQVSYTTVGLDAALSGSFGLQEPLGTTPDGEPRFLDPDIGVEAALNPHYDVIVETNHETGQRSYTYSVSGTGSVAGNLTVGEAGARGTTTGAVRVTYDAAGQIVRVAMISTRQGGVTAAVEGRNPVGGTPVNPSGSGATRAQQATVTQVVLDVDTPESRRVVQDWLTGNNEQIGVPLALTVDSLSPVRSNPDDPFADLLFREASVSRVTYDDVRDVTTFGLDVKAGWELGLTVTTEDWRRDAARAEYLGAPRPDGTRPELPDDSCR